MQKCCIRSMFPKFSQIRRNNSRQSTLSHVTPKTRLSRYTRPTPFGSSYIKITTELKNNITKLWQRHVSNNCNTQKSSDFLKWEPISSNSERYIV